MLHIRTKSNKLYFIEAAARRAGTSGQTLIRLEEKEILQPKRAVGPGGREWRLYDDADIEKAIAYKARRKR
jgi:DNA-binding transcriptional MerR regulator